MLHYQQMVLKELTIDHGVVLLFTINVIKDTFIHRIRPVGHLLINDTYS